MSQHIDEQYEEALRILQLKAPYVIQKKDRQTGEWKTVGNVIRGKDAALTAMAELQKTNKHSDYRMLQKNEADKYREGLSVGRRLGPEEEIDEEREEKRLPLMFMPEHL